MPPRLPGLRVAVLLGSTRSEGPPRPAPLGVRVGAFIKRELVSRGHDVVVVDPNESNLPLLRRPHFSYSPGKAPAPLDELAATFKHADAYVMCTPEYNHAPGPALLNMLDHFGSSVFSFKPSAIVSYSSSQWGGTRAAHALRPVLSELGCLPVSAMVHVPKAHEAFVDNSGVPAEDPDRWSSYAGRCISQLEWWGNAARDFKAKANPALASPALLKDPSERNAP
eukprot:CAMPEP_0172639534 /NCGR_PEP_ID=MMETSP1068-20121228/218967_1 /TAXON_ID=35684 /ORGANISM="Pseudopedinella elastica, Strain CCMP716" /LENGTH=223 /DNA_ID=CAMNT_0013452711 /DNA_START=78 /DNA_END=749 /DNA_ORIENTATION=+